MGVFDKGKSQVTSTRPLDIQEPFLAKAFGEAGKLFDAGGPQVFQGPRLAPFDPLEVQAQEGFLGGAQDLVPVADASREAALFNLTTGRDPSQNPFLQEAINAALFPVNRNFQENLIPRIADEGVASGGLGDASNVLQRRLAVRDSDEAAQRLAAQIALDQYDKGQGRALQTQQLLPSIIQSSLAPSAITEGVGSARREMSQAELDVARQKFGEEQDQPYESLARFFDIVGKDFGTESTTTIEDEAATLKGLLGIGSLASSFIPDSTKSAMIEKIGGGIGDLFGGGSGAIDSGVFTGSTPQLQALASEGAGIAGAGGGGSGGGAGAAGALGAGGAGASGFTAPAAATFAPNVGVTAAAGGVSAPAAAGVLGGAGAGAGAAGAASAAAAGNLAAGFGGGAALGGPTGLGLLAAGGPGGGIGAGGAGAAAGGAAAGGGAGVSAGAVAGPVAIAAAVVAIGAGIASMVQGGKRRSDDRNAYQTSGGLALSPDNLVTSPELGEGHMWVDPSGRTFFVTSQDAAPLIAKNQFGDVDAARGQARTLAYELDQQGNVIAEGQFSDGNPAGFSAAGFFPGGQGYIERVQEAEALAVQQEADDEAARREIAAAESVAGEPGVNTSLLSLNAQEFLREQAEANALREDR